MPVAALGRCSTEQWGLDVALGVGLAAGYPPQQLWTGALPVPAPGRWVYTSENK